MNRFHLRQGRGAAVAVEDGLAWRATATDERTEADRSGGRGRYGARMAGEDAAGAATAAGTRGGRREHRPARAPARRDRSAGRRRAGVEGDGTVRGWGSGQPWRGRAHGSGLTGGSHTNRGFICRPGWS